MADACDGTRSRKCWYCGASTVPVRAQWGEGQRRLPRFPLSLTRVGAVLRGVPRRCHNPTGEGWEATAVLPRRPSIWSEDAREGRCGVSEHAGIPLY